MKRVDYSALSTEHQNPRSRRLDRLTPYQIVTLMNREDRHVLSAVAHARSSIAQAIDLISQQLKKDGRLFFLGAGTSGRLGVIEAAECPPTFNTSPRLVQAIIAGGRRAVFRSQEGTEDSETSGQQLVRRGLRPGDVLVGIAASGVTPFVRAALAQAQRQRIPTILITCNPYHLPTKIGDVRIILRTGPEILTGSTRLKAGSACKMVLNILTTASMVQLGKVYANWMVDLQPKSRKLVARGQRLVRELGGVSALEAERLFQAAGRRVKPAIVMARRKCSYAQALRLLHRHQNSLRRVLES